MFPSSKILLLLIKFLKMRVHEVYSIFHPDLILLLLLLYFWLILFWKCVLMENILVIIFLILLLRWCQLERSLTIHEWLRCWKTCCRYSTSKNLLGSIWNIVCLKGLLNIGCCSKIGYLENRLSIMHRWRIGVWLVHVRFSICNINWIWYSDMLI